MKIVLEASPHLSVRDFQHCTRKSNIPHCRTYTEYITPDGKDVCPAFQGGEIHLALFFVNLSLLRGRGLAEKAAQSMKKIPYDSKSSIFYFPEIQVS